MHPIAAQAALAVPARNKPSNTFPTPSNNSNDHDVTLSQNGHFYILECMAKFLPTEPS